MIKIAFPFARLLLPLVGAGLLASLAWAQDGIFETTRRIEATFARVETLRLNRECTGRDQSLRELTNFLAPYVRPDATGFTPQAREEYRTRLEEARARPCPPPLPTPTAPKPLPQTTTLEEISFGFMLACGRDFEPARERLLTAIARAERMATTAAERADLAQHRRVTLAQRYQPCSRQPDELAAAREDIRKIADELQDACGDQWSVLRLRMLAALDQGIAADRNAARRRDYQGARTALLRRDPPRCGPPSTATTAGGAPNFEAMRRYTELAMLLDQNLDMAERDLQAGYCEGFRREMFYARMMQEQLLAVPYTPPSPPPVLARYNTATAKPCPSSRVAQVTDIKPSVIGTAPHTPATPVGTRPSDRRLPAVNTDPRRMCANSYSNHVAAKRPMTCFCDGKLWQQSTYGSGPYDIVSPPCNAATHAGILSLTARGWPHSTRGWITLSPVIKQAKMEGSFRNGIEGQAFYLPKDAYTVTAAADAPPR